MQPFIEKFREQVGGVLSGFDRLIFRGSLRRLNYGYWDAAMQGPVAVGMEQYLWQNQILFKHYADYMKRTSERVKRESLKPFAQQQLPVVFLHSPPPMWTRRSWPGAWRPRKTSGPDWCAP